MKKTVLMSAAKKARIALAVLAVCGFTFAGAQEALASNTIYGTAIDAPSSTGNYNVIFGHDIKLGDYAYNTVIVGSNNEIGNYAAHAVVVGKNIKAESYWGVAIGIYSELGNMASITLGANSKATGEYSDAFGQASKATGKYSVALGDDSTANGDYTVSVGGMHQVQVGNEPSGAPIMEDQWLRRRITNVADGDADSDAATVGQVKSMIAAGGGGASFDGSKLNTDIQNVDVAGGYKGTTTNANTDTKDTIAGAINSAYQAGKDYTDKQLTDKVGTVTNGAYIEAGKNVAENLGKLDTQVKKNTDAIGNINNLNVAGKDNLVDAVNKAYEAATSAGANVGNLGDLTTTNKDNVVGAVNEVNNKANTAQATATDALNKANTAQTTATDALNKANTAQTTATDALNKANNAQTTADNALDKANTNATNIGNLGELNTTNKGNLVGAVNEVNDKTKENAKAIEKVNGRVDELGGRVSKLDSKVNKVGAGAAALAALHPMEFDSDNKLTFAAGVGSYHGASAAAIGAFYRPSEQVMFSIAGNMGNGENMVNAGVSFALDRPSKTPTTKAALVKTVAAQNEQIAALNETLAEQSNALEAQSKEIAELKAMVQKLAAKQNA